MGDHITSPADEPGRRTRTYALALLLEALVILTLYAFGHYFSR